MSMKNYRAAFGPGKAGLDTVQRAWLNSAGALMGAEWGGTVRDLGNGNYGVHEEAPDGAHWIVWRTGDATERFACASLIARAFSFIYSPMDTGKTLAYVFLDSAGVQVGAEVTAGIAEFLTTGIYLAVNTAIPETACWVRCRIVGESAREITLSLEVADDPVPATPGYSDDLDYNIEHSLLEFLKDHVDGTLGTELAGLTVALLERDLSVFRLKPNLLIHKPTRKARAWTTDRGEFSEDFDDDALTVDTIGLEVWDVEIQMDLGCADDDSRQQWARKIDTVLRRAEYDGGVPVLDYSAEGDAPTTQVGEIFCQFLSGGVAHNFVDYEPSGRIYQDSIVLDFRYEHEFVIGTDDQLTTYEIGLEVASEI